ncbi:TPA: hypothetical protein HA351_02965 [Methanosarcinaceae archaeon]|nr:hypothetical protein [Methanosarcinaceae archaeon]
MAKLTHLLILSALMTCIVGSGCVGDDASEVEESEQDSKAVEAGEEAGNSSGGLEINETEIQELEAEIAELEALLENASLEEDIVIEEL